MSHSRPALDHRNGSFVYGAFFLFKSSRPLIAPRHASHGSILGDDSLYRMGTAAAEHGEGAGRRAAVGKTDRK